MLTAVGEGAATVTVTTSKAFRATCEVSVVPALRLLTLPSALTAIQANAFEGNLAIRAVSVPETVLSIGANCFKGYSALAVVCIPDVATSIGDGAFEGCDGLRICCKAGSAAETYAKANGIDCFIIE